MGGEASKCEGAPSAQAISGPGGADRCPFLHGTVDARPYPGSLASAKETLLREAYEYQQLYHAEVQSDAEAAQARWREIVDDVGKRGVYDLTFDELQHGIRVAWRNAPKCSNRKFWKDIKLLDRRAATTNEEMFDACLEHLSLALRSGVTDMYLTCFAPADPYTGKGPRVWNDQLLRYAGYRSGGQVLGDPANVEFTEMLRRSFGYDREGKGAWDYLPLVTQSHPDAPPSLFEIPGTYVEDVRIWHPDHAFFSELDLRWYPVPAVSALELSVGGVTFPAVPFNGWYADTEVVRDLADEGRYDKLPAIARALGLDTDKDDTLWRDRAQNVLNEAVLLSYKHAHVTMVDHHTLIRGFFDWYQAEMATRGYCPGNWKWIIPPQASACSRAYLELNRMTEYTLRPAYLYAPGWKKYHRAWFKEEDAPVDPRSMGPPFVVAAFAARLKDCIRQKPSVALFYASVSGTTRFYAAQLARLLGGHLQVDMLDADRYEEQAARRALLACSALLVLTATYGNGDVPSSARPMLKLLSRERFDGPFAVCGFGSSAYPIFCGGALKFEEVLGQTAAPLLQTGTCDAARSQRKDFAAWSDRLVAALGKQGTLPASVDAFLGLQQGEAPAVDVELSFRSTPEIAEAALGGSLKPTSGIERVGLQFQGTISAVETLVHDPPRKTALVSIDCGRTVPYQPGDHIRVFPHYADESGLRELCRCFRVHLQDRVLVAATSPLSLPDNFPLLHALNGVTLSVRSLLSDFAAVGDPIWMEHCAALADYCRGEDARFLRRASTNEKFYTRACRASGMQWHRAFALFPSLLGSFRLEDALKLMPLNKARTYSIASSPHLGKSRVDLCVSLLVTREEPRSYGLCSSFLTSATVGQQVTCEIKPCLGFRLPLDDSPILMVCNGSGIAPFRGMIQQRVLQAGAGMPLGPAALIAGSRCREEDLVEQVIQGARAAGAISEFFPAYSRSTATKRAYVQDVIVEHRSAIVPLLQHPCCHVYICGSAHMAAGVLKSLLAVVSTEEVAKMISGGRVHTEIFGALGKDVDAAIMKVANMTGSAVDEVEASLDKCLGHAGLTGLMTRLISPESDDSFVRDWRLTGRRKRSTSLALSPRFQCFSPR